MLIDYSHYYNKKTDIEKMFEIILEELGIPFQCKFRIYDKEKVNFWFREYDFLILNTNVLIEVDGDYWHGNPKLYNGELLILNSKLSCGDVYDRTFNRFKKLKTMGYTVKYIWENDWKEWSKNKMGDIPIQEYA